MGLLSEEEGSLRPENFWNTWDVLCPQLDSSLQQDGPEFLVELLTMLEDETTTMKESFHPLKQFMCLVSEKVHCFGLLDQKEFS